jgi:hypothetical protein
MQAEIFDSGAHARSSDPKTSKEAAASVRNLRASHRRVLAMFKLYGDMTDEQLSESLNDAEKDAGVKLMSPSGVRSRRSELSKPNMDRLAAIVADMEKSFPGEEACVIDSNARARLKQEGFKSELWDTGERRVLSSGRHAIVWGIAR